MDSRDGATDDDDAEGLSLVWIRGQPRMGECTWFPVHARCSELSSLQFAVFVLRNGSRSP